MTTMTTKILKRLGLATVLGSVVLAVGCSHPNYPPPPPPPPPPPVAYEGPPPLIQLAQENGFRAGQNDGARDFSQGRGYRPQYDRKFRDTPGYAPNLGPFGPYQNTFRNAYLRGYYKGFYRQ